VRSDSSYQASILINVDSKVPDQIAHHPLVYVNLPNNQIQSLPFGAFNFDLLIDVVFLNNNQMKSIEPGTFLGNLKLVVDLL
jgi:hypothetical protein